MRVPPVSSPADSLFALVGRLDHDQLAALRYRSMELLEDIEQTDEERNELFRASLLEALKDAAKYYGA